MTGLVHNPPAPLALSVADSQRPAATAAAGSATAEALQQKQADEHWERWLDKGIRRDQAIRRRFQIIGAVVGLAAAGAAAWLTLVS